MSDAPAPLSVSVVVCTRDRQALLARALDSVRASGPAGARAEIVVVEEGGTTPPRADVVYVPLPRHDRGFGYARNVGVAAATGAVVAFLDDDCEAAPGWLDALVAPLHADARLLGVAGAVMVRDCGRIGYAESILGFPGGGVRYFHAAGGRVVPTRYLSTCNCAYRRDAIQRAGGFPEEARFGGEDSLLAERVTALGPCVYAPDAAAYHLTRGTLPAVFRWFVRRGRSELAMLALSRDPARARRQMLRRSWTVRLSALATLLVVRPALAWWIPAAATVYAGAVLWRFRFARAYPAHRRAWWLVPVVKVAMDAGAEVGRWRALLSRQR